MVAPDAKLAPHGACDAESAEDGNAGKKGYLNQVHATTTLTNAAPYSPELNRIEKLWHKMKYEWLAFKARDAQTLETDVKTILNGFGTDYRLGFC